MLKHSARVTGVLYPFGRGLSYTEFEYKNLKITPQTQSSAGNVTISVDVRNVGDREGDEVVQLYINDVVSSVTMHTQELRGFERIKLTPGSRKTVTFTLGPDDLAILNRKMELLVEPGTFEVMVGSSSADICLRGSFEIVE